MDRFIARSNIDHYLGRLNETGLRPEKRAMITKLLIEEEDKLGRDIEHLEFVEKRTADGRERVNRVRNSREAFAFGTPERELADRLLINLENIQTLLESLCHQFREKISSRSI